jgi:drug/metabolite transporter (DMT)-like permease
MSSAPLRAKHYLAYILLCAIWGSTWMAIRIVVRNVPPMLAAGLRFVIAAAILLVIAAVMRLSLKMPRGNRDWRVVGILSFTMMALPYGLLFWAEKFISSSLTAILYASSPLGVALLTPLMLRKSVPRAAVASMVVALGGIAVLFQVQLMFSRQTLLGGVAVLVAVVCSSFSTVYAKRESLGINPIVSTGLQLGIGSIFLLVGSAVAERGQPVEWRRQSFIALLFLAIFGSAIAFAVYYWLLRHMHAYQLSTLNLVVPFVAIAEGALILQEMITPTMFVSAVVVLGSVAVALRAESTVVEDLSLLAKARDTAR